MGLPMPLVQDAQTVGAVSQGARDVVDRASGSPRNWEEWVTLFLLFHHPVWCSFMPPCSCLHFESLAAQKTKPLSQISKQWIALKVTGRDHVTQELRPLQLHLPSSNATGHGSTEDKRPIDSIHESTPQLLFWLLRVTFCNFFWFVFFSPSQILLSVEELSSFAWPGEEERSKTTGTCHVPKNSPLQVWKPFQKSQLGFFSASG